MKNVFIVILNWNRAQDTLDCLKSIKKLLITDFRLSIIVVDNASTDDSVRLIKEFINLPRITNFRFELIVNNSNLGYAGGNNIGIKYALEREADYVMVLNNDTLLDSDLMNQFIKSSKNYPGAGILSPKIYFAKGFEFHKSRYKSEDLGKVVWYAGGEIDWDNVYATNFGVDEVDRGRFESDREIDFATGTCMFLSARAVKQVGMFDERYFMYLEDADLSQRMKRAGWKVLYTPGAKLWHKIAQSSAVGSELNDYFITRNRLLFGMCYAPLRAKVAIVRESVKFILKRREWYRKGAIDFYLRRFGKGSWQN
ncbi:hypothetical protein A2961_03445 [Candidatus Woesebacteria bacterium RIFCSPLOWO2_01_FULL_39_21]|uniref:Glycosyltransferase 2-like domain-containing protein n=1 Tax=Candidatus Woesebacteria bacterium RIFCSPLOWO2_01_FULL_39_21 TaxID=1802519 RepID=A0A1F8BE99_9BACT|nr:MAG: hypothetical protein A2691_00475 [Candidatus Woesebacteria bacterium RIFCSPHIGHO2_01_FULL_39_23]OGM62397.1 MAG: hypothetical protein A2961_03445 [Candidatus Woesebacteria bacterium RIFCSPLOWO2_01_FULL_39_21]